MKSGSIGKLVYDRILLNMGKYTLERVMEKERVLLH